MVSNQTHDCSSDVHIFDKSKLFSGKTHVAHAEQMWYQLKPQGQRNIFVTKSSSVHQNRSNRMWQKKTAEVRCKWAINNLRNNFFLLLFFTQNNFHVCAIQHTTFCPQNKLPHLPAHIRVRCAPRRKKVRSHKFSNQHATG